MLTDRFNRRFSYLRLSVTEACNFRCDYCLPNGYRKNVGAEPELSLGEINKLVTAFARSGTRKIRITGGEPTLRDDLPEIIRLCKGTPGIREVVMTSNGYRLDKHLNNLREAGLDRINLSVDSLDPDVFRMITGHNHLRRVLESADQALELGMPVKLNAVLMRRYNLDELSRFREYVRNRAVTIRFIELMETGDNAAFFRDQHMPAHSIERQLLGSGWQPEGRHADAGPAREFFHRDFLGRIGLIRPYQNGFCDDCNRLRVSSRGELQLCLFADGKIPLRKWLANDTPSALSLRLHQLVLGKHRKHELGNSNTGVTRHLAMIGG